MRNIHTYLVTASSLDGTLLAHVPCSDFHDAERLAGVLHDVHLCIVEIREYIDGKLLHTYEY